MILNFQNWFPILSRYLTGHEKYQMEAGDKLVINVLSFISIKVIASQFKLRFWLDDSSRCFFLFQNLVFFVGFEQSLNTNANGVLCCVCSCRAISFFFWYISNLIAPVRSGFEEARSARSYWWFGNWLVFESSEWMLSNVDKADFVFVPYRLRWLFRGFLATDYIARYIWLYSQELYSQIYLAT